MSEKSIKQMTDEATVGSTTPERVGDRPGERRSGGECANAYTAPIGKPQE
jgi:hypothetical protein